MRSKGCSRESDEGHHHHRRSYGRRKTKFAIEAAKALDGEIVSCDSMQIYKYMDIGSAKPTEQERLAAKHHLIDMVDPALPFSAAMYQELAKKAIGDIFLKR